jgi:hypothetical protein
MLESYNGDITGSCFPIMNPRCRSYHTILRRPHGHEISIACGSVVRIIISIPGFSCAPEGRKKNQEQKEEKYRSAEG